MLRDVEIDVEAIVLRPGAGRHADADPVVDRARRADRRPAGRAGRDVEAVDAEALSPAASAQPSKAVVRYVRATSPPAVQSAPEGGRF